MNANPPESFCKTSAAELPLTCTYVYGSLALLQRACTYVCDSLVLPYLAQTYANAATITVITGAFQHASTPTTTTAHHKHSNSNSGKKPINNAIYNHLPAINDLPHTLAFYSYDASTTIHGAFTAATATITNTTATNTTDETPPTTHSPDYYYGYRYYSPEVGRFISRDPIEEHGGLHLYSAGKNNLISYWELLGLLTECTPWIWTWETEWRYTGNEEDMEERIKSIALGQLILSIIDKTGITGPITMIEVWDIYRAKELAKYRKYIRACLDVLNCDGYDEEDWRDTGKRKWERFKDIGIDYRPVFGDLGGGVA